MGKQLTSTFVRYLKNLLYRKFLSFAFKNLSFLFEFFLEKRRLVVDFLFFRFYGKIVVDRIEWLEQETKKRKNKLHDHFLKKFLFNFYFLKKMA